MRCTNQALIGCRYVGGVVSYYYHSDSDVIRDCELQNWINEVIVFGRQGDEKKGRSTEYLLQYFCSTVLSLW